MRTITSVVFEGDEIRSLRPARASINIALGIPHSAEQDLGLKALNAALAGDVMHERGIRAMHALVYELATACDAQSDRAYWLPLTEGEAHAQSGGSQIGSVDHATALAEARTIQAREAREAIAVIEAALDAVRS